MKKGRKIKFTLGMKIASILCCVALVSVGFAAWWIVEFPVAQSTTAGNFTVYSVTNKKIVIQNMKFLDDANDEDPTDITPENKDTQIADAAIVYGKPSNADKSAYFENATPAKTNYGWLGTTIDVLEEDLTSILQFDVAITDGKADGDTVASFITDITIALDAADIFATIGKGVAAPKMSYRVGTSGDFTGEKTYATGTENAPLAITINKSAFESGSTVTVQVKFDFGWSYTSNGQPVTLNPYLHYNANAYGDGTLANELHNKETSNGILDKIALLNSASYDVTISTTPAGSETTAAPAN